VSDVFGNGAAEYNDAAAVKEVRMAVASPRKGSDELLLVDCAACSDK
jgi:hypothetical protein